MRKQNEGAWEKKNGGVSSGCGMVMVTGKGGMK